MLWILEQTELVIDALSGSFQVRNVLESDIIGPVGYGLKQYLLEEKSFFSFGKGILTGSNIPGTKRLIFTAHSPLWDHFYISTMGGAAYIFNGLGINYVCITNSCDAPSVLEIKREN
ncbi:aldehyde ferredoxin oxidoreductase, partial [Candidatus Woesearchaeota archaeon]|nr:aldehyde ferredoxin oxidoreductase [Candidatus Woesearchaeota archaeon]